MAVTTIVKARKSVLRFFLVVMYLQMVSPLLANWSSPKEMLVRSALPGSSTTNELAYPGMAATLAQPANIEKAVPAPVVTKEPQHLQSPEHIVTTGPTQPEMQSFQSVNGNNMVDLFTGDFSYNIPLLDVGGYPVNIHYSSGITMDQEASWVGLGWNINPGTITRNMRGLPDDFNGTDKVTKTLNLKPNRTIGVTGSLSLEVLGWPRANKKDSNSLGLSFSLGVLHNNYKGWGTETGLNATLNSGVGSKGSLTSGLSFTNSSQNGLDISPTFSYSMNMNDEKTKGTVSLSTNYNARTGINGLQMTGQLVQQKTTERNQANLIPGGGIASYISFAKPAFTPGISIPFTSAQYSYKVQVGSEAWTLFPNGSVRGYYSIQGIAAADHTRSIGGYGYLYFQEAKNRPDALLDFNREKEVEFTDSVPVIAQPSYTYDLYSISGEGTGGMFRPYRSDIGFIYDPVMSSKNASSNLATDFGLGAVFHVGVDYTGNFSNTKSQSWQEQNILKDVIRFNQPDSIYEAVYFKNPGEKTAVDKNYYERIGGDRLMRVDLAPKKDSKAPIVTATRNLTQFENARPVSSLNFDRNMFRQKRDKRTQHISYLTAQEAKEVGLDKEIYSYPVNSFPITGCNTNYEKFGRIDNFKKSHHLSEITVLNQDGRRYVYGIPVYNYSSTEVSFAVDPTRTENSTKIKQYNDFTGQTRYSGIENSAITNKSGKDNYYNRETVDPYAHSFLLSGIVSPDYVDITGDGISEDDNGEAIKFNYSRVYGGSAANAYAWRAPFDSAAFNEGLKTDSRDQRASYSYGKREVWYLNSVESKSMMATFVLETSEDRKDAFSIFTEDGGKDAGKKLYRLKEINLYAKADYVKNGAAAKPIKTVHFEYSYELCQNNPSSTNGEGKLTLKKIWFTYNKNNKGQRNPYTFTYHANNPKYLKGAVDRWGNYKDSRSNPAQLSNADYPYTLQTGTTSGWDSTKAANDVAAWTLSKIKLPSGGELRVSYESDDYAYVQDKRAMQLFSIAGFGKDAAATPSSNLYEPRKTGKDYQYVFINITEPVTSKEEIKTKYLDGINTLYFKIWVKVPADKWGNGSEAIPFYAEIDGENYGIKGVSADKKIWIKLKSVGSGAPPAIAALQFLRLNLPSKAYPYSEPGDHVKAEDFIKMLFTSASNLKQSVIGYAADTRKRNLCNEISSDKSFVRLCNPVYKKLGGGLRVKRVEVYDNFNKMSKKGNGNGLQDAIYGQEYDYSTVQQVGSQTIRISSGVAAYEPVIGGEENPFRLPVSIFKERLTPLSPANFKYVELPIGESYYPSPSVGYSKVTVQTIHKDKKSATGIDVTEFYTTKDFPTQVDYTPFDTESKKNYKPKLQNMFKIAAKNYLTLSQGFRVQLNDMNGKVKSQASYAQNDLSNPISYTYNYFRVNNENSLKKQLSNTVMMVDSASGYVNKEGLIGKDIEIMVDLREQVSKTIGVSVQPNTDVFTVGIFPAAIPSLIPMPSSEITRFRSVAVMKVINNYGVLDSVIHIEKGSKVSTRNLVYDAETGDVVLTQTNNEFDDPIYNFNYPAHWAYGGMDLSYKNQGAQWKGLHFREGKLLNADNTDFNVARYFESGDELLVYSSDTKSSNASSDPCDPSYYSFIGKISTKRIWAIDFKKGKEGQAGIYFIDKDGNPFSAANATIKIIRSGKRNMAGVAIGSIMSLKTPLREISGVTRFFIDSTIQVINASAGRFSDFWRVDSSLYRKDTVLIASRPAKPVTNVEFPAVESFSLTRNEWRKNPCINCAKDRYSYSVSSKPIFVTESIDAGYYKLNTKIKSWLRFSITDNKDEINRNIPRNAVILDARLDLKNDGSFGNLLPEHSNERSNTNASYIRRVKNGWIGKQLTKASPLAISNNYYYETGLGLTDKLTQVILPETPAPAAIGQRTRQHENLNITSMLQGMVDDYYSSNGTIANAIVMDLISKDGINHGPDVKSGRYYNYGLVCNQASSSFSKNISYTNCNPIITVSYCEPCSNGTKPVYATTPVPGYYCYDTQVDTFVCKPNITAEKTNPYRWGILGNWRMYRAYTYFDNRMQSNPATATNIRKDGEIKDFIPYWSFTNGYLNPASDTSKWVWNSEMMQFNRKGYEIENRDPLNRYNSGQYGYNQSLPVAVAQNARNRESMFDGFEDYGYKTANCTSCETPRFINMVQSGGSLVDTVSHTGLYSLKITGNQTVATTVPVVSLADDLEKPELSMYVEPVTKTETIVNGIGTGLSATYRYFTKRGREVKHQQVDAAINFDWGYGKPVPLISEDNFTVKWEGKIQPKYTDDYVFSCWHDDGIVITVNGVVVLNKPGYPNWMVPYEYAVSKVPIRLEAGQLYTIKVEMVEGKGYAGTKLKWKSLSGKQQNEIIPTSQLYLSTVNDATIIANTKTVITTTCYVPRAPKPKKVTLDRYSPLQGQQTVLGAWVREEQDCLPGSGYQNLLVQLSFNSGSPSVYTLKPTGKVIEGWQRVEGVITIPATATSMTISLQSLSGSTIGYFDDLRMHPFNSNIKSFVYSPVNLRLMAELDENNYATFYEYDDDGTLVRLKKETERGIKTIKETRSALIKE